MITKKELYHGNIRWFWVQRNYQNEEKVIEVLKKILRAIHQNNYRDIIDCVDGSEVNDVKELLEYIDESLQLKDFDKIDEYGVECNFHPNYEYSQLQVYEFNDQTGFVVEYAMTSDSELVDLTLQLEFFIQWGWLQSNFYRCRSWIDQT